MLEERYGRRQFTREFKIEAVRPTSRRITHDVFLHRAGGASSTRRDTSGNLADGVDLLDARCLAQRVLCLADAWPKRSRKAGRDADGRGSQKFSR